MYTLEQRIRAVELYIKYGRRCSPVIHELGYPCEVQLRAWYREYVESGGGLHEVYRERYTREQRQAAVDHYLGHGRCNAFTRRELGYPASGTALAAWIDELAPGERRRTEPRSFTAAQRGAAVEALVTRDGPAREVADAVGSSRAVLYKWKEAMMGKDAPCRAEGAGGGTHAAGAGELEARVAELEEQVRRLELRRKILEATVELLGKDPGADPNRLTNREKTLLVDSIRPEWPLRVLLEEVKLARSSYQYQVDAMAAGDGLDGLRSEVRAAFEASGGTYGRRRIHDELAAAGTVAGEHLIARVMAEEGLVARSSSRKRSYSSYRGEISEHPGNRVNRDFSAAVPDVLWLTDVTQFSIPAGKVYLSPIVDCFDGAVVSFTMSTSPDAEMANSMLRAALETVPAGRRRYLVVHSDCGCHYRWPGWLSICEEAGVRRSMSRKGCSPDNSAMEGFFGRLKVEMFYGRDWSGVSVEEFMRRVSEYIDWYNTKRRKRSLGGMSPLEYRRSLGLAA